MNDARATQATVLDPLQFDAVSGVRTDFDAAAATPSLPTDHPAWQRDVLSLSMRARVLIAALRPLAIKVLNFWDHRISEMSIGARRLSLDPSGCYRLQ